MIDVIDSASRRAIASSPSLSVALAVAKDLSNRPEGVDLCGEGWAAWFFKGELALIRGPVPRELAQRWARGPQEAA